MTKSNKPKSLTPDPDLVARCREVLDWHHTGKLNGGNTEASCLAAYANRHKLDDSYGSANRQAEDATSREAMEFILKLVNQQCPR